MDVEERARELWCALAGGSAAFAEVGRVTVVVAPGSRLCPPGWVGVVRIGDAAIASAPDDQSAAAVRSAVDRLGAYAAPDADQLSKVLALAEVLGPAGLAYLEPADFRRQPGDTTVERAGVGDLARLLATSGEQDAGESGLVDITSDAFVLREAGEVVAAAGYRRWIDTTAHLSVLTAPAQRGRGLSRVAASAAVADALGHGLLAQWRARVDPSRRVAAALGFRELGTQLSVRLA